ncbi:gluconolactonase [Pseudoxanthomonas broegbernensis]|uniref:Gluconolactonase n=1 Tax=Pseudoxanthomonas broegbernensis TaxID=83619 RepID=A0A7V8K5Q5_9GAMM|nr:SMP-30/gluconolactonase/LRE family protein [Pseudoxanthomonas broegbernensis]KAF1684690.1 gluconolactonase [Pseudoxanthomonas broegbernensis]MBB6066451.1 gluconolactonase [Pseudoxanthomonas broegbernensis]
MRTSTPTVLTLLSTSLLAIALAACQRDADPPAAPVEPAQPDATADVDAAADPFQCPADPGTAPSGELAATRIAAADGDGANGLYEGPVWTGDALYFSDFRFSEGFPSKIRRLTADGRLETAIDPSGSNGLALGRDGALVAATHDRKELSRYDLMDGSRMRIVGEYQGQPFNSPNDLAVSEDGTIWFTDPDFQRGDATGQERTRVYRVGTDGEVTVVDDSIANPNGIALSPSGDTLYVAGGGEQGVLRAYALVDGQAQAGHDLASTTVPDGLAVDCLGNVYLTEHTQRRVRVISPQGEQLATITVDANLTNATFGGPQRRTLYLTGAGAVWSIDLDVAGLPY